MSDQTNEQEMLEVEEVKGIQSLMKQNAELGLLGRLIRTMQTAKSVETSQAADKRFRDFEHKVTEASFNATGLGNCAPKDPDRLPEDEEMKVNFNSPENHYHPAPAPAQKPSSPILPKLIGPAIIAAGMLGTGGLGTAGYVAVKAIEHFTEVRNAAPAPVSQVQPVSQSGQSVEVRFVGGDSTIGSTK